MLLQPLCVPTCPASLDTLCCQYTQVRWQCLRSSGAPVCKICRFYSYGRNTYHIYCRALVCIPSLLFSRHSDSKRPAEATGVIQFNCHFVCPPLLDPSLRSVLMQAILCKKGEGKNRTVRDEAQADSCRGPLSSARHPATEHKHKLRRGQRSHTKHMLQIPASRRQSI